MARQMISTAIKAIRYSGIFQCPSHLRLASASTLVPLVEVLARCTGGPASLRSLVGFQVPDVVLPGLGLPQLRRELDDVHDSSCVVITPQYRPWWELSSRCSDPLSYAPDCSPVRRNSNPRPPA